MKRMRKGSMGILIQESDTKHFYKNKGQWTLAREEAMAFDSCAEAVKRIRQERLKADVLLAFGDSTYDVSIPWS